VSAVWYREILSGAKPNIFLSSFFKELLLLFEKKSFKKFTLL